MNFSSTLFLKTVFSTRLAFATGKRPFGGAKHTTLAPTAA
jgi:hypothetical protein